MTVLVYLDNDVLYSVHLQLALTHRLSQRTYNCAWVLA